MVVNPSQKFYCLASRPTEKGVIYNEDIDSLLISKGYYPVLNDLRAEQQQELTPVIVAVV
jgi:hypothetical protein